MDTAPHATGALSAYPPAGRPGVYRVLCAVLISGLLLLSGCRFLHMEPLAITAWSPGEKIVDPAQTTAISIRFSAAMDSTSAEEAFTLTEEDRAVPGRFSWKGRTLSFTPFPGLRENRSYVCAVSTQAEDLQGNSLPQSFRFAFRTGSDTERPRVIGIRPADDFVSVDRMQEIEIEFSEAMDRASLYGPSH